MNPPPYHTVVVAAAQKASLPKLSEAQWTVTQHSEQLNFEHFVGSITANHNGTWNWRVSAFGGNITSFQNAEGVAKTEQLAREAVFSIIGCAMVMVEQNR